MSPGAHPAGAAQRTLAGRVGRLQALYEQRQERNWSGISRCC
ncbi:MAG TPA: hypothetical protein VGR92_16080 [Steroidobacteraceae bacterium]|nr:hypothetical protein [Steroidobacteraceae bacterium]